MLYKEYCKSVRCPCLLLSCKELHVEESCYFDWEEDCIHTAAEFYKWLRENNFKIVRREHDQEMGRKI